jgi:hypothetical protein
VDFLGYKLASAVPPAFDLDAGARANNTDVLTTTNPLESYLREFTVGSLVKKNNGFDAALVAHRQLALGDCNDGSANSGLYAVGIGGRGRGSARDGILARGGSLLLCTTGLD